MIRPRVISAKIQPLAISATTTARNPAITAPTSGMNAPRKTSDANGSASGTPMMARPVPIPDRVDERDQERRAHVADQRAEAGPAGVARRAPARSRGRSW